MFTELMASGSGGGSELALNVKGKYSFPRGSSFTPLNIPVGDTKVIAVIGAIEAWCIYAVKEDGTLDLMATGNDTNYYYVQISNGYFEGRSGVSNTSPWVVTLDKVV